MTAVTTAPLQDHPIVPVIVVDEAAVAPELAAALMAGGIRCAEITLRTPAGLAAIRAISGLEGFAVGAGTVITPEQVDECADAGATFVVSPGLDPEIVDRARERGLLALPGIATASELQSAARLGLDAVKFFPADRLGGLQTITALAAPFPQMRFMPSGGVTAANVAEYLASPAVFAVGGSWMVPRAALAARDFDQIAALSAAATDAVAR